MVPEGWKLSTFGNHVDCLTGFAFKSKSYSNNPEDIRLLREIILSHLVSDGEMQNFGLLKSMRNLKSFN